MGKVGPTICGSHMAPMTLVHPLSFQNLLTNIYSHHLFGILHFIIEHNAFYS